MLPLRRGGGPGAPLTDDSLTSRLLARQNSGTSTSSQGTTAAIVVSLDPIRRSVLPLERLRELTMSRCAS